MAYLKNIVLFVLIVSFACINGQSGEDDGVVVENEPMEEEREESQETVATKVNQKKLEDRLNDIIKQYVKNLKEVTYIHLK